MDPDGSNVRLVPTPQLIPSSGVTWSPDGTRLLIEEGRDIWSMNLDGSDAEARPAVPDRAYLVKSFIHN